MTHDAPTPKKDQSAAVVSLCAATTRRSGLKGFTIHPLAPPQALGPLDHIRLAFGRQHDDGDLGAARVQVLQKLEPAHARHVHVAHDERGVGALGEASRWRPLPSVYRLHDDESRAGQGALPTCRRTINESIDYENLRCHSGLSPRSLARGGPIRRASYPPASAGTSWCGEARRTKPSSNVASRRALSCQVGAWNRCHAEACEPRRDSLMP